MVVRERKQIRTEDCVDPHPCGTLPCEDDDLVHQFVPKRVRFVPYVLLSLMRRYCIIRIHTMKVAETVAAIGTQHVRIGTSMRISSVHDVSMYVRTT